MTQPPDYVTNVPSNAGIHNEPAQSYQLQQLSEDQLRVARKKTQDMVMQLVTLALTGSYTPTNQLGAAFDQLFNWSSTNQVGGTQEAMDRIYNAFMNITGSGRSQSNLSSAVGGAANAIAGTAALVAQWNAANGPGNPDSDAFERAAGTLGSAWNSYSTGAGTTVTDGHNAVMAAAALSTFEVVHRRNSVIAAGNAQKTELVLDSAPMGFIIGNGHNDLWLRMSPFTTWATRTGMRLRYSANGAWTLDWFNSGTATNIASSGLTFIFPPAAAGTTLSFYAGVGGVDRRFVAMLGAAPFMDVTEVGTTSQLGSGYVYRGFGGKSESLGINFDPGRLRQWTATG